MGVYGQKGTTRDVHGQLHVRGVPTSQARQNRPTLTPGRRAHAPGLQDATSPRVGEVLGVLTGDPSRTVTVTHVSGNKTVLKPARQGGWEISVVPTRAAAATLVSRLDTNEGWTANPVNRGWSRRLEGSDRQAAGELARVADRLFGDQWKAVQGDRTRLAPPPLPGPPGVEPGPVRSAGKLGLHEIVARHGPLRFDR